MSFLPDGYKIPESQGQYLKLKQGMTRFRILSSAVVGYLGWTPDNKPVRHKSLEGFKGVTLRRNEKKGGVEIKHFWTFFVWNLDEKQVQVAEITQKKIMNAINALVQNPAWGDPKGYNLTVSRSGEGLDTEYIVNPEPPMPLPTEAVEAWNAISQKANLNVVFVNGNPFDGTAPTEAPVEAPTPSTTNDEINIDDIKFE